jgi:tetratricopeptide (TPR) repeat protein
MTVELNLRFPDSEHVIVRLGPDDDPGVSPFANPITDKDLRDLQWYVETYGAHSLGDPDDSEAARIAAQLPVWGGKLFGAVFREREAQRRFNSFQDAEDDSRLLTISGEHPEILALPWELLHDPASGGGFLFMENPRISIRRRVAGVTGGRLPFQTVAKDSLHLLFVVSRPEDVGFLDPRADSLAVLDAIDEQAPGRVTCEFLRPATLDALVERLEDTTKPAVDILHFDGHGVFDREGGLPELAAEQKGILLQLLTGMIVKDKKTDAPAKSPPNTGYLLFEDSDGKPDFVSADKLGANLHRHKVSLVILSACQSAAVENGGKEAAGSAEGEAQAVDKRPMGSVAARLTATGIPSVLAMTHSVLVHTTRMLFGQFYKELARQKGIGEALDNARRHLFNHPEKYEVQRGSDRVWLNLHDWFLPALYQPGTDGPLLKELKGKGRQGEALPVLTNLPKAPEGGFFGRKRDLWQIERWFADETRRITITGFGGQGKTALAQEAGRWLKRTGLFQAAVILRYNQIPSTDALAVAVSNIGSVLGESLIDADAAAEALRKTPTLVILDNLEALAPDSLRALLDAAVAWSEAGGSRVLCTTRRPDFNHAAYRVEGTNIHRRIVLDGLGTKQSPDDALEWFASLDKLPPPPNWERPKAQDWRIALIELFDRVRFHPLSIRVLTQQLKTRRPAEVGGRLDELLSAPATGTSRMAVPDEDTPAALLASLELSLDKLDAAARKVLPRLGVFQGGAMEEDLLIITGLGESGQRRQLEAALVAIEAGEAAEVFQAMGRQVPNESQLQEIVASLRAQIAQLPPSAGGNLWPGLRRQLEAAALIEAEDIPGVSVPFLRFHPTLAPMLWAQLDETERNRLNAAHRHRYCALSGYLYQQDTPNPHQTRAIAWRELPNLLHAVHAALEAGDPDAGTFAECVNLFLGTIFGLKQEAERLTAKAQVSAGEAGSRAWFLAQSNRGEQLRKVGQVAEAAQVFQAILKQLGEKPTYERAGTLGRLGRCFLAGGRPDLAAQKSREAVDMLRGLDQSDNIRRETGVWLTDLADALAEQGKYGEARQAYQDGLKVAEELNDLRQQGVVLGQLGTLAMLEGREGWFEEALAAFQAALALDQQLGEPAEQAVDWHQLGRVFQESGQWDEAERHYRESARIKEERGDLAAAAQTWNQLANVSILAGKPEAAEMWYRKAIEAMQRGSSGDRGAKAISNLAALLQTQPGRLAEARRLAEEALVISRTIDPGAAEIWKIYSILGEIGEKEAAATSDDRLKAGLQTKAHEYRRLAREARRNFAGTRHQLRRLAPLVLATVAACAGQAEGLQAVKQFQPMLAQAGTEGQALSRALDRILAGERDEASLCEGLGANSAMIVETILQGLADPSSLADLLPQEGDEPSE